VDTERPTPLVEDIETTRHKLETWLSRQRGQQVHIPALTIPESSGMSNVTLLFEAQWQEGNETHSEPCVGRLQPQVARPAFPAYDLGLQYEVMASIGRHSDVPVPGLLGLELDRSLLGVQFYVMKRTAGRIPPDMPPYNMDGWMLHETTAQQRAAMWRAAAEAMGKIHLLDYKTLGFGHLEEAGSSALQQQLTYWQDYLVWAMEGSGHAICQAALDWLQARQPAAEPTVLCWGDSRIGNIIFRESLDGVAAVLDWEMAVLGNPVQDLAWFNYMDAIFSEGLGMPRLAGLPSYEDTMDQWQQQTGFSLRDYDYYLVFAGLRFGLLLSRIMLATGQTGQIHGNFACQLLQKTLDRLP